MAKKILIVEDDQQCIKLYEYFLGNYELSIVESVEMAISCLTDSKYDLLIVDLRLQGNMNGADLIQYIKQNNIRVNYLVVSAFIHSGSFEETMVNIGEDHVMAKPIDFKTLKAKIKGLL